MDATAEQLDASALPPPPALFLCLGPGQGHLLSFFAACRSFTRRRQPLYGIMDAPGQRVVQWLDQHEALTLRRCLTRQAHWLRRPDGGLDWEQGVFALLPDDRGCPYLSLLLPDQPPRRLLPLVHAPGVLARLIDSDLQQLPPDAVLSVACSSASGDPPPVDICPAVGWAYGLLARH